MSISNSGFCDSLISSDGSGSSTFGFTFLIIFFTGFFLTGFLTGFFCFFGFFGLAGFLTFLIMTSGSDSFSSEGSSNSGVPSIFIFVVFMALFKSFQSGLYIPNTFILVVKTLRLNLLKFFSPPCMFISWFSIDINSQALFFKSLWKPNSVCSTENAFLWFCALISLNLFCLSQKTCSFLSIFKFSKCGSIVEYAFEIFNSSFFKGCISICLLNLSASFKAFFSSSLFFP